MLVQLTAALQVGTYFTEVNSTEGSKYVPRSVQVDLEGGVTNRVYGSPLLMFGMVVDFRIRFAVASWENFSARTHISQAMQAQVVVDLFIHSFVYD
jgi:hypothetical protein